LLDRLRAGRLAVATVAGVAIGYLAHRPAKVTVTRDVIKYQDRIVYQERRVAGTNVTHVVAGPTRTEVKRVLVQVPGKPARCEETIVTERGPVVSDRSAARTEDTQRSERVVTRLETHTVAAPLPGWSLGARYGTDQRAGLEVGRRLVGGLWLTLGAEGRMALAAPAVTAGLRVDFGR
jgi:hypothetical protein